MALMIMDQDFTLLGELPGYQSLQLTRSYYGLGSFELRTHPRAVGAGALKAGRIVFFSDALHKAAMIEKLVVKGNQLTVSGKPLKSMAAWRICVPPATDDGHFGWDRFKGTAEEAYHHYGAAHLYAPADAKRKIPRLVPAKNLKRGLLLPWQSRFGNLEALFADIGETTEIGWDIIPDFPSKQYVFSAWVGRDLTQGPSKVIISEKNHNAEDVTLTLDRAALKTTAYVGGAGEDENRLIISEGNAFGGFERRESWVDAGSIDDLAMIRLAAQNKLEATKEKETLTAEILDSGLCRYERDYDVGDKVILIGENLQAETRLLEMRESYETGGRKLQATFGTAPVTVASALRETMWPVIR